MNYLQSQQFIYAPFRSSALYWLMGLLALIKDTPLPMPYLSICSPIHIRKIVPEVSASRPNSHHRRDDGNQGKPFTMYIVVGAIYLGFSTIIHVRIR